MSIIFQIVLYVFGLIFCIVFYFFYKFYLKPKALMRYYEKQGIKQSYYYPLIGKYKIIQDDIKEHGDCMYHLKQFFSQYPDVKYSLTNLAEYVIIQLYDPELLKEFYTCKDLVKHKFGVEIYQEMFNGFLFYEGEEHTRKRKIISQAFHYQLLQSMIPALSEIYDEFFCKISNKKVDNCSMMCQEIAAETVVRLFFSNSFNGFKFKGKTMSENVSGLIDNIGSMSKSAMYALFGKIVFKFGKMASVKQDSKELKAVFKKIIAERINSTNLDDLKHKQRKDLVDYLIENQGISKTESENTLTVDSIIEEFMTFYVGGLDTTGHTLGMVLYYLCIYPECKKLLLEEIEKTIKSPSDFNAENIKNMKYLEAFVKEILRHYTVADQIFSRTVHKDIQIGEIHIKKGTLVNVGNIENHFNPKYYKDPQIFNPMRWMEGSTDKLGPFAFNPFSSGKNNCIGQHLAQLEIKVGIIKFLQKFDFELDPDYKLVLTFSFLVQPKDPIPITFKPRLQKI